MTKLCLTQNCIPSNLDYRVVMVCGDSEFPAPIALHDVALSFSKKDPTYGKHKQFFRCEVSRGRIKVSIRNVLLICPTTYDRTQKLFATRFLGEALTLGCAPDVGLLLTSVLFLLHASAFSARMCRLTSYL